MYSLLFLIEKAHAGAVTAITPIPAKTTSSSKLLQGVGNQILSIMLLLAGIVAVFYLIYCGYLMISSAGNPEKVKQARAGIINAVIGIIIILSAFWLVRLAGVIAITGTY